MRALHTLLRAHLSDFARHLGDALGGLHVGGGERRHQIAIVEYDIVAAWVMWLSDWQAR